MRTFKKNFAAIGCMLIFALVGLSAPLGSEPGQDQADVITPKEPLKLFSGTDLTHFYTWLVDHRYGDPEKVFSVVHQLDGGPAIRVSGRHYGGLITRQSFANYRLVVEYRWGLVTWAPRQNNARDSGILLHAQGPEGNVRSDFNGPWMRSIEFQIIEGGVGDFILIDGYDAGGELERALLTVTAKKDRDGEDIYDPQGTTMEFNLPGFRRINWLRRDPDWQDALGFRGQHDVDNPAGQWTRLEAICEGDKIINMVNGQIVNRGSRSNLTGGRLLFQSEGAEIFFRRIDIEPLHGDGR